MVGSIADDRDRDKDRDRLIATGVSDIYFLAITMFVTLTGYMYVLDLLPAYDPAILAQPALVTYLEYLGLALGGTVVLGSFILRDKILVLQAQWFGLLVQTVAAGVTVNTVAAYGGRKALFIILFGTVIVGMHMARLVYLRREITKAPALRELGERVEGSHREPDSTLQTLLALASTKDRLEAENRRLAAALRGVGGAR